MIKKFCKGLHSTIYVYMCAFVWVFLNASVDFIGIQLTSNEFTNTEITIPDTGHMNNKLPMTLGIRDLIQLFWQTFLYQIYFN